MTGLEKIVQQIRDEAQQAADAVIAQAKEEAGQLAAKAAEDARTQSGAILAKSKTDVQNHLAAARSAAELAQRRAVLAAKQEIIGEAIESARQSIYKLPDSDYFALILKMISKFSLPQEGELLFSPADLGGCPPALRPRSRNPRTGSSPSRGRPATSTEASCSATAASRRTARSRRSSTRRASVCRTGSRSFSSLNSRKGG